MEKLIRLINEYGHTSNCGQFETCRIEPATEWNSSYLVLSRDDNGEGDWKSLPFAIPRLISKEYGFIKWLVENDKIDRDKVKRESRKLFVEELRPRTPRYKLLILLSISDTPIDFLCDIIKN